MRGNSESMWGAGSFPRKNQKYRKKPRQSLKVPVKAAVAVWITDTCAKGNTNELADFKRDGKKKED